MRINTQLVQVDVVVTDKNGVHVDDLTADDFELLVDNKPQPLSHFALIRLPSIKREVPPAEKSGSKNGDAIRPPSMPTKALALNKVKRTIAFVVDDLGLSFQSMYYAREAVKKFVDEQVQDGDLVGIIRTGRGLGALQQFTSDRRILYAAVDRLAYNPESRQMMAKFGADAPVASDGDPSQQQTNDFDDFNDTYSSQGTLGALNFVVQGLRELPGRKMVIFVSDGFNMFGTSGDDVQVVEEMKRLADQANRASVVIYSLDAKGLQTLMPKAGDDMSSTAADQMVQQVLDASVANLDSQAGMVFLSQQTGGFAMLNNNDLNFGVRKALEDNESYYLLGFDPDDQHFNGRYHSIKVRARRPGLQVRTRGGFYGVEDNQQNARPKTPMQQMLSTLSSPFGARDVQVQMTSFFVNSTDKGSYVRSFFYFDPAKLTFKEGPDKKKSLALELATFAFNEEGKAVDQYASHLNIDLDEEQYQAALSKGLVRMADVPIKKPGAYQFHAVIRDTETGRLGSASQFIQVPDLSRKQLALSGLLVSSPAANSNGSTSPGDVIEDLSQSGQTAGIDPQPTAAVRRFARTGVLGYGAWVFNATLDKRTKQPQLSTQIEIFHNGKRVFQAPAHPVKIAQNAKLNRIPCGGQLKLTGFPPGDYMLRLIVIDSLAKQKYARTDQWMDFSVR
ncbi:MAG: VWA domain-containing protein [Blastocatellia bacterium]|nr:VWA domain-containing protein [Blastocatellia bacterium]